MIGSMDERYLPLNNSSFFPFFLICVREFFNLALTNLKKSLKYHFLRLSFVPCPVLKQTAVNKC